MLSSPENRTVAKGCSLEQSASAQDKAPESCSNLVRFGRLELRKVEQSAAELTSMKDEADLGSSAGAAFGKEVGSAATQRVAVPFGAHSKEVQENLVANKSHITRLCVRIVLFAASSESKRELG